MGKNKILTISVAAYNLEKLIEDNLKSFVNSEVNDLIEVIVTDDGSKDKTSKIVEKYVKEYPDTIVLVKQQNMGAGSTVNSGIKHATGKYFKMVDGDDWVETENLNVLVKNLQNIDADMIITNYETYDDSAKKVIDSTKFSIEPKKETEFKNICEDLHLDMHNAIYKTSILQKNNIVLDNGFYTDVEYLLLPIPFINKVIYYDMNIYVYRIAREGQSVSLPSMQKNIAMHDLVLKRLIKYYEENKNNLSEKVRNYITNRLGKMADTQLVTLLTFETSKEQKNKIKQYFKEIKLSSEDVYNKFIEGKKEKILLFSNYSLYKMVSKIVLKKFKKEGKT